MQWGGSGYDSNDTVQFNGALCQTNPAAQLNVDDLNGVILKVEMTTRGLCSVIPSSVTITSSNGSGAKLHVYSPFEVIYSDDDATSSDGVTFSNPSSGTCTPSVDSSRDFTLAVTSGRLVGVVLNKTITCPGGLPTITTPNAIITVFGDSTDQTSCEAAGGVWYSTAQRGVPGSDVIEKDSMEYPTWANAMREKQGMPIAWMAWGDGQLELDSNNSDFRGHRVFAYLRLMSLNTKTTGSSTRYFPVNAQIVGATGSFPYYGGTPETYYADRNPYQPSAQSIRYWPLLMFSHSCTKVPSGKQEISCYTNYN